MHHGQEIYLFFFRFGIKGLIGASISSILLGVIVFFTFRIIEEYDILDYKDFIQRINNNGDKYKLNKFINIIINIFLLISFYIMIAGFSAFISQELNVSSIIGSIIIVTLAYFTFKKNIEGIIKVNTLLIPILIILIIAFGLMGTDKIYNITNINEVQENGIWLIYSILYASYNSIVLIPILITLKKYIKNNKQIMIISLIIVFIIILLQMSICAILSKINIDISEIELPTIYIINFMGKVYKTIYGFIILFSIFTTAISSGYSFLVGCSKSENWYKYLNILICVSGIIVSRIGFSKLINLLYPLFGLLGLIQIFFLIKSNFKLSIEKKRQLMYK